METPETFHYYQEKVKKTSRDVRIKTAKQKAHNEPHMHQRANGHKCGTAQRVNGLNQVEAYFDKLCISL